MRKHESGECQWPRRFFIVQRDLVLFVIAIMQACTGAAYFGKNLVRDQTGQAYQHGIAQDVKQHGDAPSSAFSFSRM
jgi:hypothetical protein